MNIIQTSRKGLYLETRSESGKLFPPTIFNMVTISALLISIILYEFWKKPLNLEELAVPA
jgi:hypothetical protein